MKEIIFASVALVCITIMFCSCTISINLIQTSGKATDVVDEDQKADANVDPQVIIPASAL